jgi:hypothetical protein
MKKLFVALSTLVAAACLANGGSVVGNGGFRQVDEGVATFAISVFEDTPSKHFFVFASEGSHGDYPDTVFKSIQLLSFQSAGNTVVITGNGLLYNEIPVSYTARIIDAGDQRGDYLELHCMISRTMHIVHFAEFLTAGDLVVRQGK